MISWISLMVLFFVATFKLNEANCIISNANLPLIYDNFDRGMYIYRFRRPSPKMKIRCEKETLTPNFHVKFDALLNSSVEWLEIGDANSPEIASGAFKSNSFTVLADIRINGINVQVIEPGAFEGLNSLRKLSLKNNRINTLPQYCFGNLTNLITLDLSYNNIVSIHEETFKGLSNLESLFLQNNNIDVMPDYIFQSLPRLIVLDLSFNEITNLNGKAFQNLSNLIDLWLNNNRIINILLEDITYNTPGLTNLYLNNNFIASLTDISFPKPLTLFNLSNNQISAFNFKTFSQIDTLDLSYNSMTTLQENIFFNLTVKELILDHNFVGLRPVKDNVFKNLTSLEILSLQNNKLRQLSPSLFENNQKLRILKLSQNNLTNMPSLSLPQFIIQLNLSSNTFTNFPNLSKLKNLTILDLSYNNLQAIEFHSIENLTMITNLNLQNNKITKLSLGCFRNLRFLMNLNLGNNNISTLQIGIFVGANKLMYLDISHNKLQEISEGIFHNLRNLRVLNLSYNNISYFSVKNTLSHLTWLSEINLQGNNWPCKFLTNFVRDYKVTLTEGYDHNVTNVYGIACRNVDEEVLNSSLLNNQSSELTTNRFNNLNNVLLTLILTVLIIQLLLKGFSRFKASKFMKSTNEQELHLIENPLD